MNDIKRNRTLLAIMAVLSVVAGVWLAGALPKGPSPAMPAGGQAAAQAAPAGSEEYLLRDYGEFGNGAAADLPAMDWLGLGVKLAFVIALIYLGIWALRRYVYRDPAVTADRRPVSLLGSLNLTPSRTVYVLEVGGKVIVVGATASQMALLTEVTDPAAVEQMRGQPGEEVALPGQFSALLGAAHHQFETRQSPAAGTEEPPTDRQASLRLEPPAAPPQAQTRFDEGRTYMEGRLASLKQALDKGGPG